MFKRLLALASIMTCAITTMAAHALEPGVAFVGGNIMYNWANSGQLSDPLGTIPQYPLFLNDAFQLSDGPGVCHETSMAQTLVNASLQNYPNVLAYHLLVGADDVIGTDDANPPAFVMNQWETCYTKLVNTIIAARKKVILGTIPFTILNDPTPYNDFIFTLAAQKGLPVIDYYTLLRRANDNFEGTQYWVPQSAEQAVPSITSQGYQLMTQTAATVIDQVVNGVTLKSGYLGVDTLNQLGDPPYQESTGGNQLYPNSKVHFTAYGTYSDGKTLPFAQANIAGAYGTWTSDNAASVYIDQTGTAWGLAPGKANIKFTTFSGVTLSEWTEYVSAYDPY